MSGKPQVSPTRLDSMLGILSKHPGFKGRVRLTPDGGVEIDTVSDETPPEDPIPSGDLTETELAALSSTA